MARKVDKSIFKQRTEKERQYRERQSETKKKFYRPGRNRVSTGVYRCSECDRWIQTHEAVSFRDSDGTPHDLYDDGSTSEIPQSSVISSRAIPVVCRDCADYLGIEYGEL